MNYKITPYFCDNGKSNTNGYWFTVTDKLIRLTAKLTEAFASDVFFIIQKIYHYEKEGMDFLIVFRENGVNDFDLEKDPSDALAFLLSEAIQVWRLTDRSKFNEGWFTLQRVDVKIIPEE